MLKVLIGGDIWKRKAVSFRPQLWNLFAERADPLMIGPRLTRLARMAASGGPKTAKPKRDNRRISNLSSDAILSNNVDFDLDQTLIPLHVDRVELVTFPVSILFSFFWPFASLLQPPLQQWEGTMTDKLPPPLLALFQPRPPLRYVTPLDRAPEDVKKSQIGGIAQFLPEVKKYEEEVPYTPTESWIQRKWRQKQEQKENLQKQLTEGVQACM